MRKIIILLVVLIGVAGFAGWYFGEQKTSEQYDIGFHEGQELGYEEGHSTGYREGFLAAQTGEEEPEPEENVNLSLTLDKFQNSKMVDHIKESPSHTSTGIPIKYKRYSISIRGKLIKISNQTRELTVADQGDELTLYIEPDTLVTTMARGETLVKDGQTYSDSREVRFEDIEIGDYIQIELEWSTEMWPDQPLRILFIDIP